jgi:predicted phosphatase
MALEWLNSNASFISTLSTIGMLILTFFYVIYTQKILKVNQEMILEERNTRREENMPNVIAYFDVPKIHILNFIVENIGKSVAINTRVELLPMIDFIDENYLRESFMINNDLTTLAPNQKLKTFVDTMFVMYPFVKT